MIDEDLISCFIDEVGDLLTEWERSCLALEENNQAKDNYTALFRAAHNMKGTSRAVGLEDFGAFVHKIEDLIQKLMSGEQEVNFDVLTLLFGAQNTLKEWVEGLKENLNYVPDTSECYHQLNQIMTLKSEATSDLTMQNKSLQECSLELLEASRISSMSKEEIELEKLFNIASAEYQATQQGLENTTINLAEEIANDLIKPIEKVSVSDKNENVISDKGHSDKGHGDKKKSDETIRISANKLDALIQLVGELSIHHSIISEANKRDNLSARVAQNSLALSAKITRALQHQSLSLRMQPVQGLFQRLERALKDVARAQSKSIEVLTDGADVELDKMVLEKITDPLIHIVRNAVDHGLEDDQIRRSNGKTERACVWINAAQDAGGVVIEIKDNGRGINKQKVLEKAIAKKLIKSDQDLSEAEIYLLLFQPGFSTADQVTDISGRGVGMDVVMKAVQSLNGSIEITSELGEGTSFSIRLPTSLSILEALIVEIDQIKYAIPMQDVSEIIDLSNYIIEPSSKTGQMLSLRGKVVPLFNLAEYMPQTKPQNDKISKVQKANKPALIIRNTTAVMALQIDSILTQQQIVVRQLTRQFSSFSFFGGSTILGDGEPGMIINLPEIARNCMLNQVKI